MKTNINSKIKRPVAGFTLIEIMLVLAIIALLAGTAIFKLGGVLKTGEQTRIKEDIKAIEIALLNYKIAANGYPTTDQGLQALLTKPADARGWNGPYFDDEITDPWGNEYGYRFPSQKGQRGPDIFQRELMAKKIQLTTLETGKKSKV